MCQYGEQFQKNTRLVTSVGWLNPLAKKCHHKQHEVWLKGKVKVQQRDRHPIYVSKTALAGAYPWKFACRYAELIKHNVEFRAGNQEEVLQWGAALRSAAAIKRKPRPRDRIHLCEIAPEAELLEQAGGAKQFVDFIALGRQPKEAWKALENQI